VPTVRADRALRWAERLLLGVGVACLTWYGYVSTEAAFGQRHHVAQFEQALSLQGARPSTPPSEADGSARPPDVPPQAAAAPVRHDIAASVAGEMSDRPRPSGVAPEAPHVGSPPAIALSAEMVGVLDIPRLRLSAPVLSGDDERTLRAAAGHLPDTPLPWESGNAAIAAHRDGLFRPLRHIRTGDSLRVRTVHGDLEYEVSELKVVEPEDLSVLETFDADTLTLITCYPFNYIGAAPQRFIVHARRLP
jgi:sortase A